MALVTDNCCLENATKEYFSILEGEYYSGGTYGGTEETNYSSYIPSMSFTLSGASSATWDVGVTIPVALNATLNLYSLDQESVAIIPDGFPFPILDWGNSINGLFSNVRNFQTSEVLDSGSRSVEYFTYFRLDVEHPTKPVSSTRIYLMRITGSSGAWVLTQTLVKS